MRHVFIVGAKSLGAYGGYETFVNKLTEYHKDCREIKYHVFCKANGDGHMDEGQLKGATKISDSEFEYHNAHCIKIHVPNIGSASAIYYDLLALNSCCRYIRRHNIEYPLVYILACRIGPFAGYCSHRIHNLGGMIYLNPDGHEWLRAKWGPLVKKYWKISESMMVKHSDLVICDSINIEKYIHDSYDNARKKEPIKTTYIAYGADMRRSVLADDDKQYRTWLENNQVAEHEYYLTVGRFVPENNYEIMIREFMRSGSQRELIIITNTNAKYFDTLEKRLHCSRYPNIKFVGAVYNQELLKKIRENAYCYIHGHEVGGTSPSLIEALSSTKMNLLLDVGFNREVAAETALYWTKDAGSLAKLIRDVDQMRADEMNSYGEEAKKRALSKYSWRFIAARYKQAFIHGG